MTWPRNIARRRAHLAAYWTTVRRCIECQRHFAPLQHNYAKYCSTACRMRAVRARAKEKAND